MRNHDNLISMIDDLIKVATVNKQKRHLNYHDWLVEYFPLFTWTWPHLVLIQNEIEKVLSGKIKKLLVTTPPRHGKTEGLTIRLPIYFLRNNPSLKVIIAAYGQILANKFSRRARMLARDQLLLSAERSAVEDWETTDGGGVRAVGVGGGITGQGGNLIIIDDPVKNREDANSQLKRDKVWDWYREDLYTRLEPGGAMILIQTRWHEDDLAGRILSSDESDDWVHLNLPAIAEENDILGREVGTALCPERFTIEELLKIRKMMGNGFEALYQQRPSALEGNILHSADLKIFEFNYSLLKPTFILQSWDTAFEEKTENDYSVCTTWFVCKDGFYLIDLWKDKADFNTLKNEVQKLAFRYKPNAVIVEKKASGHSIIQELRKISNIPIIPVEVDRSKIARANVAASFLKSGRVYVPEKSIWVDELKRNLNIFPNGAHDDDVDSFTQALIWLSQRYANNFPIYSGYNDTLHCEFVDIQKFQIIGLYCGIYWDTELYGVLIGLTAVGQIIIINEFYSAKDFDHLYKNVISPFVAKYFMNGVVTFNFDVDSKVTDWYGRVIDLDIDVRDVTGLDFREISQRVDSLLNSLVHGDSVLKLIGQNCENLREGFMGGYTYQSKADYGTIYHTEKPIKNRYAKYQFALNAALSSYDDDANIINHDDGNDDRYEGRSKVTGY